MICSDAFIATADAMAQVQEAPGYSYVTTPHPVAGLTAAQVHERAEQVAAQVARAAGRRPGRASRLMAAEPDPDVARDAIEYCYAHDWTDGLPVVPASRALVDQFLAHTSRSPDEVLWRMDHLGTECTVQTAAINAAMAGCLPEYFPVVLAAWDAVMRDRAAKGGGWQSTSGPAPLIVVNGPDPPASWASTAPAASSRRASVPTRPSRGRWG